MTRPGSFADVSPVEVAAAASLLSDVARACMVSVLLDGCARTAGELAAAAGVTPQTASSHLSKFIAGGLVSVVPQGRHRYHRLASPDVAHALEALSMLVASPARMQRTPGPKDPSLRDGRTCYDHFAGRLGVAITDALVTRGVIVEERQSFHIAEGGAGNVSYAPHLGRPNVSAGFPEANTATRASFGCTWVESGPYANLIPYVSAASPPTLTALLPMCSALSENARTTADRPSAPEAN